jgi:N-acetyl-gamma-glutamyl-phosphate reductase
VPEGVAVVGAAGYGGAVASAILCRHPSLELTTVTARSDAGRRHDDLYPRYRVAMELEPFDPDAIAERAGSAVVGYPHRAAAPAVKALRERGLKVVDLSADFRLDRERYERWYQPHEAPELLDGAVYGLTEAHRDEIRGADLVVAPGC